MSQPQMAPGSIVAGTSAAAGVHHPRPLVNTLHRPPAMGPPAPPAPAHLDRRITSASPMMATRQRQMPRKLF
ncbi:hypothetical protein PYCC9005_000815 [Savitreella phatthalungensis]